MELKDIIGQALEISKEQKFLVRIYDKDYHTINYKESEMSYFELGTYLITNLNDIERVDIRL